MELRLRDGRARRYILPPNLGACGRWPGEAPERGARLGRLAATLEPVDLDRSWPGGGLRLPSTGQLGVPPLTPDWDLVPARGRTPHTCGYRSGEGFAAQDCRTRAQHPGPGLPEELAERLHLPFPVLSDSALRLATALGLPTLEIAGHVLLARLSWVQRDARIEKVFYPVFPPDKNAGEVLAWLRANPAR
jgi:hypothetical protein